MESNVLWQLLSTSSQSAIEIEKKSGGKRDGNPHSGGQSSPDGSQNLSKSPGRSTYKDSYGYREGKSAIDALEVTSRDAGT